MYKSRFQREGFFRPSIAEDVTISGKLKEHTVDIYFEFVQMNNLERTVIKTIEGTEVTEKDVWEFANILKDLHFFAKGIIYYDAKVSSGAETLAESTNIDLKKFNFRDEVRKNVLSAIKVMLPDEDIIGDPFWMFMNLDGKNSLEQNLFLKDGILLFENKYFAELFQNLYLLNYNSNIKLVGVSQPHLKEIIFLKNKYKVSVKLFNQFRSDLNNLPYHFWDLDVADIEMYIR